MAEPPHKYKYDKGENRRKHVGTAPEAQIAHQYGNEVGECPRGFSLEAARELLDDAIEEYRSRQPDVPFRLWSYHDGAVYQARTSDGGTTWHGWPVAARHIPDDILPRLEARALAVDESDRLKKWLRQKWAIKRS